jgi:hypothetical protein
MQNKISISKNSLKLIKFKNGVSLGIKKPIKAFFYRFMGLYKSLLDYLLVEAEATDKLIYLFDI